MKNEASSREVLIEETRLETGHTGAMMRRDLRKRGGTLADLSG
jgi:hypothetical protein